MIVSGVRGQAAGPTFDSHITTWNSPTGGAPSGGDWSDAFALSDDIIALTVGDVAGHGIAVAEPMIALRAAMRDAIGTMRVPSEILTAVNTVACDHGAGVIATAIVALLDRRHRTLCFANAGHPPPLMLTFGVHAFLRQPPADLPLGIFRSYRAADYVIALPPDALVVFYTDGITEHDRDPVAGEAELVQAARAVYARPEINAARAIARRVFGKRRGGDDAAAIGLRTLSARARRPAERGEFTHTRFASWDANAR